MVNYFPYDYAPPTTAAQPFSTNVAVFPSPWSAGPQARPHRHQGLRRSQRPTRPRANLVFLIDTSGSMNEPNKLPLVKQSLSMLVDELDARRHGRDRHLCRQCRHRARADAGPPEGEDPRGHRQPRRRRQHRRRRGHPPGLRRWPKANFDSEGRQPRDPGDRRRLQRRHHRPGRAQGLSSSASAARACSSRCSASAWATTTTR